MTSPGALLARFWWGLSRPFALVLRLSHEPVAFRAWSLTVIIQAALTLLIGSVLFVRDLQKFETGATRHANREAARKELRKAIDVSADAGIDLSGLEQLLPRHGRSPDELDAPTEAQLNEAREALAAVKDAGWPVGLLHLDEVLSNLEDAGRMARQPPPEEPDEEEEGDGDEDADAPPQPPKHGEQADAGLHGTEGPPRHPFRLQLGRGDAGLSLHGTLTFSDDEAAGHADAGGGPARKAGKNLEQILRERILAKTDAKPREKALHRATPVPPPPPKLERDEPDDEEDEEQAPQDVWKKLALWASSLVIVQTVLLALTRDYHDRLARDLSLVAGLVPEDLPKKPGLRIDLKWLWRKLRRRIRGFLTTASGIVALSPMIVLLAFVAGFDRASSVVVALVSAYWWVVFTGARSARAWRLETDLTPPTPLRALSWVHEHVPGFRWFGPRWILRFALWGSQSMFAPARSIERDPAAFLGLALARVVGSVPVVRIALRAALVVAAGELLEATADLELEPREFAPADEAPVSDPLD